MTLGSLPALKREEAEQVAEHIFKRWPGLTGKPDPGVNPEAQADFVQAVFRKACLLIEERQS